MGPMLPIVNPVLWEIGHVGWFHEYWTLRHAGEAPGLDRADVLEFEHGRPRDAMGSRTCPTAMACSPIWRMSSDDRSAG